MGAFQVVFSPLSERDLEKIVRYIAKEDTDAAERFGCELTDLALSLSDPNIQKSGTIVVKRPGVRKLTYGSYLVLYRVFESQQKVRVLRFWHGARDRKRLHGL